MLWKEYEDVLLEREDNVATILLNNPANMNPGNCIYYGSSGRRSDSV